MTLNVRSNNDNEPFVLDDSAEVRSGLTLAANQGAQVRGCALGEIGTTAQGGTVGQLKVVSPTASDGSQVTKYLLADETIVANTGATTTISVYTRGLFDQNQITFATTATTLATQITLSTDNNIFASMRDVMRMHGLRLADAISVTGYENT